MGNERCILHVDMDAFYASVEQLDHPEWRGKPVLVAHDGPRGVVSAASYEARKFGCRSAQPTSQAKRLCPHAVIAAPRFARYHELSRQLRQILYSYSPMIEPISIDEAFVDVTGSRRLHGDGPTIAAGIRARVRGELQLTCSVGVAPNKFLAKLASDLNKPDGLTVITPETIDEILLPLPVMRIWGIGAKSAGALEAIGVRTMGQLRSLGRDELVRRFGDSGAHWWQLAHGLDDRQVVPESAAKSVGQEETFAVDLVSPDEVLQVLLGQAEQVAARLRRERLQARGVTVKIRFGNFETITRSRTLSEPTDQTRVLWHAARDLFQGWSEKSFEPVRLIGVQAMIDDDKACQMSLFADPSADKQGKLDRALDAINSKLGSRAVYRGGRH